MLKLEQMEVLVGATIGMLEENLSMEGLYEQIMFAKFLEELGVPEMAVKEES